MKPIKAWIGCGFPADDYNVIMEYTYSNIRHQWHQWHQSCRVPFEDTQTPRIYNELVATMLNRIYDYVNAGDYFNVR
jgi:hypothetical protein